jgi:4-amino-4-deoxy-L-arabinose transferase-like glycosyltransferase
VAWRPLALISAGVLGLLVAVSPWYGPHRDELYFVEAGRHLDWGYVDQPPFTPLLARLITEVVDESLVALRLPAAAAAALVVLLTGLIGRELGAEPGAQVVAAASMAVAAMLLIVGHMLSTATFDLLFWTLICYLVVRQLGGADGRGWLLVGLATGLALQNKTLPAFLVAAVLIGLLLVGPRAVFRSGWLWGGAAIAGLVWLPNLLWQASRGWPQVELAQAIAAGSSGSSQPWWLFLPMQLVLISPVLVPVWIAGLVRLWRAPDLRPFRCFAVAYGVLAVVFLVTGGKPYYLAGLYPILLAAGAPAAVHWLRRRRGARGWVVGGFGLSLLVNAVLMLPVVPARVLAATPITAINYDAGETVGWPAFVTTVAEVHNRLPAADRPTAVVVTQNYGQAGAIDYYGPRLGLPDAFSGHNAYYDWGPPPETGGPTIVIGFEESFLRAVFGQVDLAATVDNQLNLDNDEQGRQIWICRNLRGTWTDTWPRFRNLR